MRLPSGTSSTTALQARCGQAVRGGGRVDWRWVDRWRRWCGCCSSALDEAVPRTDLMEVHTDPGDPASAAEPHSVNAFRATRLLGLAAPSPRVHYACDIELLTLTSISPAPPQRRQGGPIAFDSGSSMDYAAPERRAGCAAQTCTCASLDSVA